MTEQPGMTELLSDAEIARRVDAIRDNLAQRIPQERTRHRRRVLVVYGVAAGAVALTGAALVVRASSDVVNYEVRCYEAASLEADYGQVQSALGVDENGVASRAVVDPVETCGDLWRMGLVGQPTPPDDPNAASFDVPELVGCELRDGSAAGFPRSESTATDEEFCHELGLAPWN